jgi:hypothetical protein
MQVQVTVSGDDKLIFDLKRFAQDFPKVLNSMLRYSANKFIAHVRKNYLSGQMLNASRGGKLWKGLRVRKTRGRQHSYVVLGPRLSLIYEHPGGAVIKPKQKKSLAWGGPPGGKQPIHAKEVRLVRRPFMSAAQNTFNFDQATNEAIRKIMDRELKKRGFR